MQATPAQIHDAAWSTVPTVPYIFFTFRFMVLFGFVLLGVFLVSLWHTMREAEAPRWLFRLALLAMPLPWLASEFGWFVAEFGRQPWIIDGVLPTFLATSELGVYNLVLTIIGFTVVYGVLAVIEVSLMLQAIKKRTGCHQRQLRNSGPDRWSWRAGSGRVIEQSRKHSHDSHTL